MSKPPAQHLIKRLQDQPFPGLFCSRKALLTDDTARRYQHLWERAWEKLKPNALLCIEGWPTVYFRRVVRANPAEEQHWQRQLWNLGHATLLVVFDDRETRIYSALATPNPPQGSPDARQVGTTLETVVFANELVEHLFAFQTGAFYARQPHRVSFAAKGRLDRYLLRNLSAARDRLCATQKAGPLEIETAHALLGRCLFASYLLEREALDAKYLRKTGLPAVRRLHELLHKRPAAEQVKHLYDLFAQLQEDFNGSLFGSDLAAERAAIRAQHLDIVREFLIGLDFESGQQPLPGLDFYDFSLIPIELISAIYEDFVAAADRSSTKPAKSAQREAGAYYTPPRLAELVVDIATNGLEDRLDTLRCLDPSCGSGIFLVLLFQRMAQRWRAKHPRARNVECATELRKMLTERLHGVDSNEHACRVACFSLYLAFLDQFEKPRDIRTLQREFYHRGGEKLLPELLGQPGQVTPGRTIHPINFFSVDAALLGGFDLIIGNPPWTGRYQAKDVDASKWIEANAARLISPASITSVSQGRIFYPQSLSVVPFLWKIPDHCTKQGECSLLLPSKLLLANQTSEFQAEWFAKYEVESVWQLGDYSFILFENADCPAVVIRFGNRAPNTATHDIRYYTPKVERFDPRESTISVAPDEQKWLALDELLDAAKKGEAFTVWKRHFWGTPRDQRLLDRLLAMPRLQLLADEPDEHGNPKDRNKRWLKSQGFQPWGKEEPTGKKSHAGKPKPRWWTDRHPILDVNKQWGVTIVPGDLHEVGPSPTRCRRLPHRAVHQQPLLLVNHGFSKVAYCEQDVLFTHRLNAISGRGKDQELLALLAAVLLSPLGRYLMFHLCGTWGTERLEVHLEELLLLPFQLPEQHQAPDQARQLIRSVAKTLAEAKKKLSDPKRFVLGNDVRQQTVEAVTEDVFKYYAVTRWERDLIADTADLFVKSCTPASLDADIPTLETPDEPALRRYADYLCRIIEKSVSRGRWHAVPKIVRCQAAGVALLSLERQSTTGPELPGLGGETSNITISDADKSTGALLKRLAHAARRRKHSIGWVRGFTLVELDRIHILKPLTLRYWTVTAAMNDADRLALYLRESHPSTT